MFIKIIFSRPVQFSAQEMIGGETTTDKGDGGRKGEENQFLKQKSKNKTYINLSSHI